MSEHLGLDTLTGKVRGTSSNTGNFLTKPIDFSEVYVTGIDLNSGVESGVTPLVSGQSYIDVVFSSPQDNANWILTECQIVNQVDPSPLNLWSGVVTSKTTTGFRLQLNARPDTANYDLHWAINIAGSSAVGGPGISDFLGLTDTPNSYAGQGGKAVKVNTAATGLEFGVAGGSSTGPAFINVLDYGAKADMVTLFDITMPNGNVVTSAAHTFVEADIGKWAVIRGATAGGVSPLMGKITAVSGHTATLDTATTTALTNLYATDSFPRMDFGTDNTIPFIMACLAVPGPGNRDWGGDFGGHGGWAGAGQMNPILPGDGGTVYIPRGNYLLATVWPGRTDGTSFWWIETNNLTLKGDGMGQTVIFRCSRTGGSMPLFGGFEPTHGMFQNWLVCDMTFYDLNYFTGVGNSLDVRAVDNCHIERIEICNSRGNGGINYQGDPPVGGVATSNRLWIKDCWIHGITEDGYSPGLFHSIEGDGMNVGQVRDVHIEGNTIVAPGRHAYEGGGNCADQYFIGNTIDMRNPASGASGGISGINPTGGSTTVIMGNTIKGVYGGGFGIDLTTDVGPFVANDIRVIGNYVHGNMQAAFRFQNTSGETTLSHVDRIIVANNWVEGDTNVSTAGVMIGGGNATQTPSMLIVGNWFNNPGTGFLTVAGVLSYAAGKYVIIKDNFFAGIPVSAEAGAPNLIIEGNMTLVTGWNRYGGSAMSCNIDGNNVLAGAIYSNTATGLGYVTTDQVEVIRGATTAGALIIWAQVTAVGPPDTVTTYVYNPTGSTLNTGATCKYIVHRRLP